ncbi:hypothetical protein MMC14_008507 [Varicellaria rhodocarpa]|nr:hypothetical protein [Varicellaria rhodocarpa]
MGLHAQDGSCRYSPDPSQHRSDHLPRHLPEDSTQTSLPEEPYEEDLLRDLEIVHSFPNLNYSPTQLMSGGTVEFGPGAEVVNFTPGSTGLSYGSSMPTSESDSEIKYECDGSRIAISLDMTAAECPAFSPDLFILLDCWSSTQTVKFTWENSETMDPKGKGKAVQTKTMPNQSFIEVTAKDKKELVAVYRSVINVMTPTTSIDESGPLWHHFFSTIEGEAYLIQVSARHRAFAIPDIKNKQIKVYGHVNARMQFTEAISTTLRKLPPFVFKMPLHAFQQKVADAGGLAHVAAMIGKAVTLEDSDSPVVHKAMLVTGTVQDAELAQEIVDHYMALRRYSRESENSRFGWCVICFSVPEDPVITTCNHRYCKSCFNGLCFAAQHTGFPIRCSGYEDERCMSPLTFNEIKFALSHSQFDEVLRRSFQVFVNSHLNLFRHCPVPDCPYVFSASDCGTKVCPSSFNTICLSCRSIYHEGMSCAAWQDIQKQKDASLAEWKTKAGAKDCPQCGIPILKSGGCNHITCRECQGNWCWLCLEIFKSGGPRMHFGMGHRQFDNVFGGEEGDEHQGENNVLFRGDDAIRVINNGDDDRPLGDDEHAEPIRDAGRQLTEEMREISQRLGGLVDERRSLQSPLETSLGMRGHHQPRLLQQPTGESAGRQNNPQTTRSSAQRWAEMQMQLNQVELQLERVLEARGDRQPRLLEQPARESAGPQNSLQARRGLTQRLEGIERDNNRNQLLLEGVERAVDKSELLLEGSLEVRGNRQSLSSEQPAGQSAAQQINPTPRLAYSLLARPQSPPQSPRRSEGQIIRETAALIRHLGSETIGRRPGRPMIPPQPLRGPERLSSRESAIPSRHPFSERIGGPSWWRSTPDEIAESTARHSMENARMEAAALRNRQPLGSMAESPSPPAPRPARNGLRPGGGSALIREWTERMGIEDGM